MYGDPLALVFNSVGGPFTQILSGSANITGSLTLSGGTTLDLQSASASVTDPSGGKVNFVFGGLNGDANSKVGSSLSSGGGTQIVELLPIGTATFNGVISDQLNGVGTQSLQVIIGQAPAAPGGVQIFTGANSYSGGTIIASGATLQVSGSSSSFQRTMNIVNSGSLVATTSQQVGTITGSAGSVTVNGGTFTAYQIRQNSLTIGSGATVALAPSGSGSTTNPAGPNNINFSSSLTSLNIAGSPSAWTGTLDIGNNGLVIAYGSTPDPYSTINNMIESGYNGGVWGAPALTALWPRRACPCTSPRR